MSWLVAICKPLGIIVDNHFERGIISTSVPVEIINIAACSSFFLSVAASDFLVLVLQPPTIRDTSVYKRANQWNRKLLLLQIFFIRFSGWKPNTVGMKTFLPWLGKLNKLYLTNKTNPNMRTLFKVCLYMPWSCLMICRAFEGFCCLIPYAGFLFEVMLNETAGIFSWFIAEQSLEAGADLNKLSYWI